jgi:thiamine biosynthesis lipoprotein
MALIRVSRPALGSAFELFLGGEDSEALEAVGYAALDRVDWLEQQLSHFLPDSEICQINRRAFAEPVFVSSMLMSLLLRLRQWSEITEGAFDPTAGQLVRAWGFFRRGQQQGESVAPPSSEEIHDIVRQIGWRHVELNEAASTVRFLTPRVELHLGAVGKGYIVQAVADYLRQEGVACALLHSGQSSIVALGSPPERDGWPIGIPDPYHENAPLASVSLADAALSTSGTVEQFVIINNQRHSHLFDPRTGFPAANLSKFSRGVKPLAKRPAANRPTGRKEVAPAAQLVLSLSVLSADAAEGDALSTAFFVQGEVWARAFCQTHPDLGVIVVEATEDRTEKSKFRCFGDIKRAGMRVESVE